MKCKCEKCGAVFEATGQYILEVLTGGKECPQCGGNVCLIEMKRKKQRKRE